MTVVLTSTMPTSHSCNDGDQTTYIDLERPYDFFTNGDIVRGRVRVHPTERPNGIKIEFRGRCKMKLFTGSGRNRQTHKSVLDVFQASQLLFDSNTSNESYAILNEGIGPDGKVDLPFEFRFPDQVMMAPSSLYRRCQSDSGFEHEAGHPLPTSMEYDGNSVYYLLEALVYKTTDWAPDKIIKIRVPFRPTAPFTSSTALVKFPRYPELYLTGHHLNPNNDQNPGFLTKLKWSALSKYQHEIPGAKWRFTARCPFLLIAGEKIPLTFSFYETGRTPELPEAPDVYVRQIGVKLTSILTVRIPYDGITGLRSNFQDIEKQIINKVFDAGDTVMYNGLRLDEFGSLKLPPTTLPSFGTYGLRLLYRIKVVVEGFCANKDFKYTALRDLCHIACNVQRPGRVPPSSVETSRNQDALPTTQQTPIEEQLPAYDPAPNYEETPQTTADGHESVQQGMRTE